MTWAARFDPTHGDLHRAIIEQSQDAVIFADRDGVIRLWNRGAEIIFGWGAAEAWAATSR